MTYTTTPYTAKQPNKDGIVAYTDEENSVWRDLYERQRKVVEGRACDEYIRGLDLLNLPQDRIPQCPEVTAVLQKTTGWTLEPVPALIPFEHFFFLLANRKFPAATFIRTRAQMDYLTEPDIFHEVFGHCPLLTNPANADFTCQYGRLGLKASHKDRVLLARLFWFTVEFGLVNTPQGVRAYGGGILSSKEETIYCVESPIPDRRLFDPLDALRTPYRIDEVQKIYYVIPHLDDLFQLIDMDLMALVKEAKKLGDLQVSH